MFNLGIERHIERVGISLHTRGGPPNPDLFGNDGTTTLEYWNLGETAYSECVSPGQDQEQTEKRRRHLSIQRYISLVYFGKANQI